MHSISLPTPRKQTPLLRAMIEIRGAELSIYPIAQTDSEAAEIFNALRFIREDFER